MKPKTFSLILLASLTLNALLGGWIIARALHKRSHDPSHKVLMQSGSGPHLLRRLVGAAGGPRSPRFGELKGPHPPEFRQLRGKMASARARVDDELKADPFSEKRFEAAVRELEALEVRGIAGANELAVQLATKMTKEERARALRKESRHPH